MNQAQQCVMADRHPKLPGDSFSLDTAAGEGNGPQCFIQTNRPLAIRDQPVKAFRKYLCGA
ncbi:hypothetical protein [Salinicoccus sp. ID82-1]|uniref:hypothetical protein n=1 Tax=Salinicoccus sp. ID82-1 TaxID=2820269 RepID=UPI001F20AC70|nr:hypothetical protein [Salinicoccus sp. ID82-1]